MKYVVDDKKLNAATFIAFVNQVWQGSYDVEKTQGALSKTINIMVAKEVCNPMRLKKNGHNEYLRGV